MLFDISQRCAVDSQQVETASVFVYVPLNRPKAVSSDSSQAVTCISYCMNRIQKYDHTLVMCIYICAIFTFTDGFILVVCLSHKSLVVSI